MKTKEKWHATGYEPKYRGSIPKKRGISVFITSKMALGPLSSQMSTEDRSPRSRLRMRVIFLTLSPPIGLHGRVIMHRKTFTLVW